MAPRLAWHPRFMRCGGAVSLASVPVLMIQFQSEEQTLRSAPRTPPLPPPCTQTRAGIPACLLTVLVFTFPPCIFIIIWKGGEYLEWFNTSLELLGGGGAITLTDTLILMHTILISNVTVAGFTLNGVPAMWIKNKYMNKNIYSINDRSRGSLRGDRGATAAARAARSPQICPVLLAHVQREGEAFFTHNPHLSL